MHKQQGTLKHFRSNVHGAACSCCGSRRYQLVLRSVNETEVGHLVARVFSVTTRGRLMTISGVCCGCRHLKAGRVIVNNDAGYLTS